MIYKKLSEGEAALLEILEHPLWCSEFLRKEADPMWELTFYQKEVLLDCGNYISFRAARATGKCLDKDSRLVNTLTGGYKTVEEYYKTEKELFVPALDQDTFKQVSSKAFITDNGIKSCLRLKTVLGKETTVTEEHPFLTPNGWVAAKDLTIGTYIAIPRSIKFFGYNESFKDSEVKMIAHFIAEGTRNTGLLASAEKEFIIDMQEFIGDFGGEIYQYEDKRSTCVQYNFKASPHYKKLLRKLGLLDKYSHQKFIPDALFELPKRQIIILLSRLFGDDGWYSTGVVGYSSSSKELAYNIKHLLLRFGIQGSISKKKTPKRDAWIIDLSGDDAKNFLSRIGFYTHRKNTFIEIRKVSNNTSDTLPLIDYKKYHIKRADEKYTRTLSYFPTLNKSKRIVNKDAELIKFQQVRWVKVKELEDVGERQTYSIEVEKYHTLVADDIYSHNTEALIDLLIYYSINDFFPTHVVALTTPNRVHLTPIWRKLTRWLGFHPFLRHFRKSINSQTFTLGLSNGLTIDCRIAGVMGTGASVIGLHSPIILLDEAGFYNWPVWVELGPTLNVWENGFKLYVCGTPSGQRENNVLYYADMESQQYTRHRVSSFDNPRYTKEDDERNQQQYGGKEGDDYQRLILGQHSSPVTVLFAKDTLPLEPFSTFTATLSNRDIENDPAKALRLLESLPKEKGMVAAGIDLGYCYSEDTEVLTSRGWLKHSELLGNEMVVCYNTETNLLQWNKPEFLWQQDYSGKMIEVAGKSTNFCVSPEHSVLVSKVKNGIQQRYEKLFAKDLLTLKNDKFRVKIAGDFAGVLDEADTVKIPWYYCDRKDRKKSDVKVSIKVWLKFLAWFISEGSATANRSWEINIVQNEARYSKEIEEVLTALPYTITKTEKKTSVGNTLFQWRITCKELCLWLRENCGIHARNKKIPDFIFNCSTENKELFLRTMLLGDGTRINSDRSPQYTSSSNVLIDQVQALAISLGYSSTRSYYKKGVNKVSIMNKQEHWLTRNLNVKEIEYNGKIYCLKTPTGFYVTRRKGKVAIQGNTDPTVISLFSNTTGPWKHFARITLLHIEYPKQVRFIDKLDDLYGFSFLAIDEGSSGLFIGQEILSDKYKHKAYADRLITVAFGAMAEIGLDLDGNPLKVSTRNLAVEKLRSLFNNKSILLSSKDSRLISELQRVEGTRTPSGNTVYRVRTPGGSLRGEDHRLASFLCFSYAIYMKEDYKESKPKPTKLWSGARWGRGRE